MADDESQIISRYRSRPDGGSLRASGSTTYDYSGTEEQVKRQDALAALSDEKFGALYSGDIPKSVQAGNRVRGLVGMLKINAPGTTERAPYQVANPLVKVAREDSDFGISHDPGEHESELLRRT
jgi:hypothetical protein